MLVSKLFKVALLVPKIQMSGMTGAVQLLSQHRDSQTAFLVIPILILYTNPYGEMELPAPQAACTSLIVRESLLQVGWELCCQLGLAGHLGWGSCLVYLSCSPGTSRLAQACSSQGPESKWQHASLLQSSLSTSTLSLSPHAIGYNMSQSRGQGDIFCSLRMKNCKTKCHKVRRQSGEETWSQ